MTVALGGRVVHRVGGGRWQVTGWSIELVDVGVPGVGIAAEGAGRAHGWSVNKSGLTAFGGLTRSSLAPLPPVACVWLPVRDARRTASVLAAAIPVCVNRLGPRSWTHVLTRQDWAAVSDCGSIVRLSRRRCQGFDGCDDEAWRQVDGRPTRVVRAGLSALREVRGEVTALALHGSTGSGTRLV